MAPPSFSRPSSLTLTLAVAVVGSILCSLPAFAQDSLPTPAVDSFEWLGTFGAESAIGNSINSTGDVVGNADFASYWQPFFYVDGVPVAQGVYSGMSYAAAINERSEVAGGINKDGYMHAFRRDATGKITILETAGFAEGLGIDAQGTVMGRMQVGDDFGVPFRWHPDGTLDVLNGIGMPAKSSVEAMSSRGHMAGSYAEQPESERLLIIDPDNTIRYPAASGYDAIVPNAINAAGRIVGELWTSDLSTDQGFLWDGAAYTLLTNPAGYVFSEPISINDFGQIVGFSRSGTDEVATLWQDGTAYVLQDLASTLLEPADRIISANGISNNGWVTGQGINGATGKKEAFRLKLFAATDLIVNRDGDGSDLNPGDGTCDSDAGQEGRQCTLRAAIEEANKQAGRQMIRFDIRQDDGSARSDVPVIQPATALPTLFEPAIVDARTQPAGVVEIDGSLADSIDGLTVFSDSVTIRRLVIHSFGGYGIRFVTGTGHVVERNRIGYRDKDGQDLQRNGAGGIFIGGGATNATIGGLDELDMNHIVGGVTVSGERTRGIRVLKNVLEVPEDWLSEQVTGVPLDLGGDGPTCTAWPEQSLELPNNHLPPPRITKLASDRVEGLTRPGATVVVYKVTAAGTGRGRYFARSVAPIAHGGADDTGSFSIALDGLPTGTLIAATATDAEGNTSELSQLRRPVIVIPGAGGSWLTDASGTPLWIPIVALTDAARNDLLYRLRMDASGNDLERIVVNGALEDLFGIDAPLGLTELPYGPIFTHLEAAGFPGDPYNENGKGLDVWRFANDWRRSTVELAAQLREAVDGLTNGNTNVARSCEVDLVGHSNGGIVGSLYLRTYPESADRVHRLITIGTPYLGTPQGAAAQTRGYIFEADKSLFFDADWGRMLEMTRNVPGAYGLMPSKNYWLAMKVGAENQRDHYLVDLYNTPLRDYGSTFDFLTRDKVFLEGESTEGFPPGLARNAAIWQDQQDNVHDLIDDWRSYNSPPQIFRFVGDQPSKTAVGWELGPGKKSFFASEAERSEVGDTDDHRGYRERLVPVLGRGDGTVALLSATLGHNQDVGETDFSGVEESPWIEEFEYYDCDHVGLIAEDCARTDNSVMSLDRVVEVLRSGYEVIPQAPAVSEDPAPPDGSDLHAAASAADWSTPVREVFYVTGSAPIAVDIQDDNGKHIGPSEEAGYGTIEYELPEVAYWPGKFTVVLSVPIEKAYRITASAPEGPANIQVSRMTMREDGGQFYYLFEGEDLAKGGELAFDLESGGMTPAYAELAMDADGDGQAEGSIPAGMTFGGFFGTQPVPTARPRAIRVSTPVGELATASVEFTALGEYPWTWSVTAIADWVQPDAESGELPGVAGFKFGSPSLTDGIYRDTLKFTLSYYGSVHTEELVPVELQVGAVKSPVETPDEDLPRSFALYPNAPNPFSQQTTLRFDLPRPSAVRLVIYDMLGRSVAVPADGSYTAGRHALTFDANNFPSGVYLYRLETDGGTFTQRMLVVR